jgi:hypothetical protein
MQRGVSRLDARFSQGSTQLIELLDRVGAPQANSTEDFPRDRRFICRGLRRRGGLRHKRRRWSLGLGGDLRRRAELHPDLTALFRLRVIAVHNRRRSCYRRCWLRLDRQNIEAHHAVIERNHRLKSNRFLGAGVARQAVEGRAVVAGKAFQLVQRAGGVEGLGIQLQRAGAVKQPAPQTLCSFSAAACGALSVPRKKRSLPEVAAATSAWRCTSRLSTGRQ